MHHWLLHGRYQHHCRLVWSSSSCSWVAVLQRCLRVSSASEVAQAAAAVGVRTVADGQNGGQAADLRHGEPDGLIVQQRRRDVAQAVAREVVRACWGAVSTPVSDLSGLHISACMHGPRMYNRDVSYSCGIGLYLFPHCNRCLGCCCTSCLMLVCRFGPYALAASVTVEEHTITDEHCSECQQPCAIERLAELLASAAAVSAGRRGGCCR